MTSVDELALAGEFPAATREQWQELVLAVLRRSGGDVPDDVDEALGTRTYDGVLIRPLYTADDAAHAVGGAGSATAAQAGVVPGGRGAGPWDVRQRHADPDPVAAAAAAVADLEHGVTSLWVVARPGELRQRLDGVLLDLAGVALGVAGGVPGSSSAGARGSGGAASPSSADVAGRGPAGSAGSRVGAECGAAVALAGEFLEVLGERGIGAVPSGSLGLDPIGGQADDGALDAVVELARRCEAGHPGLRAITVDGLRYHEAGGSAAQEVACTVAAGVEYLRVLTAAGMDVAAAAGQLEFRYAATADQFLTIATLRAARRVWHRVTEVCGAPARQVQHVVTSPAMQTRRDPWVNLLRSTIACFAGGVAGADAITVLPFDHAIGRPDAFARRIARNTHALLVEESHVARVADPAAGSWYVDTLTEELAAKTWELFRRIESTGGMRGALRDGTVAAELAATWAARRADVAHRRAPITGVSEFPDLTERPVTRPPWPGAGAAT
ncbi:MAG TPA: methylmalonyl-CoA mutase subunit beta, partial [Pseudonocardiaceae bacterium]